jgi:hypothetical protein
MSQPIYLLDTNMLTGILKKDARVVAHFKFLGVRLENWWA